MSMPRLYVDFNEMLEPDLVLLSRDNEKKDIHGKPIVLYEGLSVIVSMDDIDESGKKDDLIAEGVVERNTRSGWASEVKWCCRINQAGVRNESSVLSKARRS